MRKLIQVAAKFPGYYTKDGEWVEPEILKSLEYFHSSSWSTNGDLMIKNAGLEYLEIDYVPNSKNKEEHTLPALDYLIKNGGEILTIYEDDDFDTKKNKIIWGTYGPSGRDKYKYIKLSEATTDHLMKILLHLKKRKYRDSAGELASYVIDLLSER